MPKDYKNFLLRYNGGEPDKKNTFFDKKERTYSVRIFFGFFKIDGYYHIEETYKFYHSQNRIMPLMLPIAEDNNGNLFLLSLQKNDYGSIYFWDHELEADEGEEPNRDNLTFLAKNFPSFFEELKEYSMDIEPDVISVWVKPGTEALFKEYKK